MTVKGTVILLIIKDDRLGELQFVVDAFIEFEDDFVLADYLVD